MGVGKCPPFFHPSKALKSLSTKFFPVLTLELPEGGLWVLVQSYRRQEETLLMATKPGAPYRVPAICYSRHHAAGGGIK